MKSSSMKELQAEYEKAAALVLEDTGEVIINGVPFAWDMPASTNPRTAAGIAAHNIRPKLIQALGQYRQALLHVMVEQKKRIIEDEIACDVS